MVDDVLYLNQQKYIQEILDGCGFMDIMDVHTLITYDKRLSKADGTLLSDDGQYRYPIGGL